MLPRWRRELKNLAVRRFGLGFGLALSLSLGAKAETLTPVWVELGPEDSVLARVVVSDEQSCPAITVDGVSRPMTVRWPIPVNFRPACEFTIPAGAKSAKVGTQTLALPRTKIEKVIVLGDTGCRIKGARVQDCNDPAKWPLQRIAATASAEKPELVIHVGDYLYREDACPAAAETMCGGVPPGDNWPTWEADFFKPAAKLLAAAPWALSRGNHEDCSRSFQGWFYYLEPRPWGGGCPAYTDPYVLKTGGMNLVMFDSSATKDDVESPKDVERFAAQLGSIQTSHAWLIDHHPFFGLKAGKDGKPPESISLSLQAAWKQAAPHGIDAILSGHTHLFELLSFGQDRPLQIVAGDGGTALAEELPHQLDGIQIQGAAVMGSEVLIEFGYTVFERGKHGSEWKFTLHSQQGHPLAHCRMNAGIGTCGHAK
jgi:predicted phosphodiesterase